MALIPIGKILRRKLIYDYTIGVSGKMLVESKFQPCLYMHFAKIIKHSLQAHLQCVWMDPTSPPQQLLQYIPRNMHTVFALLCFVVVIHWLIFPYPSGLPRWHCDNLTIAPVPAKQPWWIWINTSCEFIMNDCITTTKQSITKPCAYYLRYTVGCQATCNSRDSAVSCWQRGPSSFHRKTNKKKVACICHTNRHRQ